MGRLQHAADVAVTTVLSILVDKDQPAASRVRATISVLKHATQFVSEDLEARIEVLEQKKTPAVKPALPGESKGAFGKTTSRASLKQERILLALLEHGSDEKAAAALGVSAATIRRQVQNPQFQKRYRKAKRDEFSTCMGRLLNAVSPAITILRRIMVDTNTPAAIRLQAAEAVFEYASENLAFEGCQARIGALESALLANRH
jgi:hypothetical protein